MNLKRIHDVTVAKSRSAVNNSSATTIAALYIEGELKKISEIWDLIIKQGVNCSLASQSLKKELLDVYFDVSETFLIVMKRQINPPSGCPFCDVFIVFS